MVEISIKRNNIILDLLYIIVNHSNLATSVLFIYENSFHLLRTFFEISVEGPQKSKIRIFMMKSIFRKIRFTTQLKSQNLHEN